MLYDDFRPHWRVLGAHKFKIGLIQSHQGGGRHHRHKLFELLFGDGGAGGIIRITHKHQPRGRRDRRRQGRKIHAMIRRERHRPRGGSRHPGKNRVRLKAPPGKHYLIPSCAGDLHQLLTQGRRPAPHRNLFGAQLQVLGDGMNKIRGPHVRITIRRGGRLRHGGHRGRQWGMGYFIAGKLECIGQSLSRNI